MAEQNYACGSGWLLEPQEDGSVLPFFLKVRYNDVVYQPDMIYDDALLDALTSYRKVIHGSSEMKVSINAWDVTIYEDHTYKATMGLPIVTDDPTSENGERFVKNDVVNSGLFGYVTLPFTSKNGYGDIQVVATLGGASKALLNADIISVVGTKTGTTDNYTPVEGVIDSDVTEVFLQIDSRGTIPTNFTEDAGIQKGIVYLTVTGTIDLSAETLIPDIALAAGYTGGTLTFI